MQYLVVYHNSNTIIGAFGLFESEAEAKTYMEKRATAPFSIIPFSSLDREHIERVVKTRDNVGLWPLAPDDYNYSKE